MLDLVVIVLGPVALAVLGGLTVTWVRDTRRALTLLEFERDYYKALADARRDFR